MGDIFHTYLSQPLFNLLVYLYNVIPGSDIGFAIIVLTILIKAVLWPFMHQSLKSQKAMQVIQPKIEELKKKHADNKEALAKDLMELYQEEKVNPLSSCLPLLIQLPVLIALYRVLLTGFDPETLNQLYSFVANPGSINSLFLGFIDLSKSNIYLALVAGFFQFLQTRMLISRKPPKQVQGKKGAADENMMATMNKSMMYFMPIITVVIGATLPGGLTLYWVAVNIVSIIQQKIAFSDVEKEKTSKEEE